MYIQVHRPCLAAIAGRSAAFFVRLKLLPADVCAGPVLLIGRESRVRCGVLWYGWCFGTLVGSALFFGWLDLL